MAVENKEALKRFLLDDNNAVWNLRVRICVEYERKAFVDGLCYGTQLMTELQEN